MFRCSLFWLVWRFVGYGTIMEPICLAGLQIFLFLFFYFIDDPLMVKTQSLGLYTLHLIKRYKTDQKSDQ